MKKPIFVCFAFMVLALAACKKNNSTSNGVYTRVGHVYDDSSRLTTEYDYTPSRLLSDDFNYSGTVSHTYNYPIGQCVENAYINGTQAFAILFFLNDKSLVDSSSVQNTSLSSTIEKKYTYDSNNFLTNVKWYNDLDVLVLIENFTISGNNIVQHSYTVLDSTNLSLPSGTYTYAYNNTSLVNTLGNDYYGQDYLGTSSKNPPSSSTYSNTSGTTKVNYRYNYSGGNISSELIYIDSAGINGPKIDSLSFSYYD